MRLEVGGGEAVNAVEPLGPDGVVPAGAGGCEHVMVVGEMVDDADDAGRAGTAVQDQDGAVPLLAGLGQGQGQAWTGTQHLERGGGGRRVVMGHDCGSGCGMGDVGSC